MLTVEGRMLAIWLGEWEVLGDTQQEELTVRSKI